jgi:general secretion pathway protein G
MLAKHPSQRSLSLARAAFTLMEMLVVVAILVVLAGASVPIYLNYLDNAKRDRAKVDVQTLQTAIEAYKTEHGQYPQSLQVLTMPDQAMGSFATLEQKALIDPWGNPYVFDPSTMHPQTGRAKIYSQGPPGRGMVISNW